MYTTNFHVHYPALSAAVLLVLKLQQVERKHRPTTRKES